MMERRSSMKHGRHALVMVVLLGACGGDDGVTDADEPDIDGAPTSDAGPPDGALADRPIMDLTGDELVVLCEDVTSASPGIAVGMGDAGCVGEDCEASVTAVEECAAASPDQPFDCSEFAGESFDTCAQPASELSGCLAAYLDQFVAYAEPTCATVDALPPFNDNPATIAACAMLADACPEIF
jgi:hypothetical protein